MSGHNNIQDLSLSSIRMMDERGQKDALFTALRNANILNIKHLLQANRNLLNAKLFGFEGADLREPPIVRIL